MIPTGVPANYPADHFPVPDRGDADTTAHSPASLLPTTPTTFSGSAQVDDSVMQISGTGHWFLESWISDHSVEFLVDSGSSVTAMSNSFYQTRVRAGAPLGVLEHTARTLRSANRTGIGVSGCSHCVASFMGLQTEFPIIICDLATGTDAIIGTDVLGSVLPHTLDIKNGLLFTEGGASLQLHRRDSALSGRVVTVGHCSIQPYSEAVLLLCPDYWWSSDAIQRFVGGTNTVRRKYRPDCGQNSGGSDGRFRSSCRISVKKLLWWTHVLR